MCLSQDWRVMVAMVSFSNTDALLTKRRERPDRLTRPRDQALGVVFHGQVGIDGCGMDALFVKGGDELLRFGLGVVVVHHDRPAGIGQMERNGAAQALGGAGDEHGFLGRGHGSSLAPLCPRWECAEIH